ncbi:MAG: ABC transporter substrate-binding protein [Christensenellaceae bacterium]
MKKILIIFVCVLMSVMMFAACAQPAAAPADKPTQVAQATESADAQSTESAAPAQQAGVTVTDMMGKEVTIEKTDKIVSLTPAGTEMVFSMGRGDSLVGIDGFSNFPEQTAQIKVVGDFNGPDLEAIAALEPDVIFSGNTLQQDAIDGLEKLGLKVVCVEATTYEQIPQAITLVGDVLSTQDAATDMIANIGMAEEAAKEAASKNPKTKEPKSVYYAMSYGDMGNWSSGPGSFINSIVELCGGVCVTKDAQFPWVEFPIEDLVSANPDIVLLASDGGTLEEMAKAQGYKELDAVKNGSAYIVNADVISRPGPRIAEAITMISELINK